MYASKWCGWIRCAHILFRTLLSREITEIAVFEISQYLKDMRYHPRELIYHSQYSALTHLLHRSFGRCSRHDLPSLLVYHGTLLNNLLELSWPNWWQIVFYAPRTVFFSADDERDSRSHQLLTFALVYSSLHGTCNCVSCIRGYDQQNQYLRKREILYISMLESQRGGG
jgi:hypothetical protein